MLTSKISSSPITAQQPDEDRIFWLAVREAILIVLRAIERRHLPGIAKKVDKADARVYAKSVN